MRIKDHDLLRFLRRLHAGIVVAAHYQQQRHGECQCMWIPILPDIRPVRPHEPLELPAPDAAVSHKRLGTILSEYALRHVRDEVNIVDIVDIHNCEMDAFSLQPRNSLQPDEKLQSDQTLQCRLTRSANTDE